MKKPLTIALVVPSISSVKAFFLPLLQVESNKVHFHVITSGVEAFDEDGQIPDTAKVHYVKHFRSLNPVKIFAARASIKRLLSEIKPDIIHAHFLMAAFVIATINTKVLRWITLHGVYHLADNSLKGKWIGLMEKFAILKADRVEVLNVRDFNHLNGSSKVKLLPIPGVGVNTDKFDFKYYSEANKKEVREELGLTSENVVLLYLGRYTTFKGYPTVIEVANKISATLPNIKILTCGAVDDLHSTKSIHDKPSNLIDVGWSNKVEKYMSVADLMIFPSRREGLPVTVMEALSMKLPVIAYHIRGVEDLIKDGENGFLVEDLNEDAFVNRLFELLKSPEKISKMKQEMAGWTVNYSSEIYVQHQLNTYLSKS